MANDTDTDIDNDDDASNFSLDSIDSVTVAGWTIDPVLVSGSVTIVGNQVVFAPGSAFDELDADDTATATIDYTMSDDDDESSSSVLPLTVTGANDLPSVAVANNAVNVNEGETALNNGTFSDLDLRAPNATGSASVISPLKLDKKAVVF